MPEELPQLETTPRRNPGEDFHGSLYPYIDYKGGMVSQILNPIRRVVAPINPFASQQVPSKDSLAISERWGNGFWMNPNYVKGTIFSNLFPNHYDSSSDDDQTRKGSDQLIGNKAGPGAAGNIGTMQERLPRACERAKMSYDKCKMVNGKEKCSEEGDWVLGVCPNWALQEMAQQKAFMKKVMLVQREEYRHGMAEADYNRGRSVGDISNKTHVHGTRQYLRPDTMWADERYRSVTRDEIKAAKERHNARLQAQGRLDAGLKPEPHMHDSTGAQWKVEKLLY